MHGLELALLGFAALLGVAGFVLIVLIALDRVPGLERVNECPICGDALPVHHLGACEQCRRHPHRRFICGSTR